MPVQYDTRKWPIAKVKIDGKLSDDDMSLLLEEMAEWMDRGLAVTVLDVRENKGVDIGHLRKMAGWMRTHRERAQSSATVMIVNSGFMRAAVDVVFRLAPGSWDYEVHTNGSEADRAAHRIATARA